MNSISSVSPKKPFYKRPIGIIVISILILFSLYRVVATLSTNLSSEDVRSISLFLKSKNMKAMVVEKYSNPTFFNRGSVWLVKSDGSKDKLLETNLGNCGDFIATDCLDRALINNHGSTDVGLSPDHSFVFKINKQSGDIFPAVPDIYDLSKYMDTGIPSQFWQQLKHENKYSSIPYIKGFSTCTSNPISPSGKFLIRNGTLYRVTSPISLTLGNELLQDISEHLTKITDVWSSPTQICDVLWSADEKFLLLKGYGKTDENYNYTGISLSEYDLVSKETKLITNNYSEKVPSSLFEIVSTHEYIQATEDATYDLKFENEIITKTKILNKDVKLIGIIN